MSINSFSFNTVCRHKIVSIHPSYTLRRVVEAHLKRESVPFEVSSTPLIILSHISVCICTNLYLQEGYNRKQREADTKLKEVFVCSSLIVSSYSCVSHLYSLTHNRTGEQEDGANK